MLPGTKYKINDAKPFHKMCSIQHICFLAKNNVKFNANFFRVPLFDQNNQKGLILGLDVLIDQDSTPRQTTKS